MQPFVDLYFGLSGATMELLLKSKQLIRVGNHCVLHARENNQIPLPADSSALVVEIVRHGPSEYTICINDLLFAIQV